MDKGKLPVLFYNSIEEYQMTNKGRKPKWLTIERFEVFLNNDFKHLNWKVNLMLGLSFAIMVAVIAKFITGQEVGNGLSSLQRTNVSNADSL